MEIYWIENKQRKGPISVSEIISLLEAGDITPETKGWHKGCAKWLPMHELPALSSYFHPSEPQEEYQDLPPIPHDLPADAQPPVAAIDKTTRIFAVPAPVLRLWARVLDLMIYTVIVLAILYICGIGFHETYFSPIVWVPAFLIEAFLISRWSSTPGKWLMGIRVVTFDEKKLGLGTSLTRSIQVYIFGMGLVLTIFMPIMMLLSWWTLRKRGITMWDQRLQTLPLVTAPVRMERILIAAFLIFILMEAARWLAMPWMPDMIEYMSTQQQQFHQIFGS